MTPGTDVSIELVMPAGSAPATDRLSPAFALVSVTVIVWMFAVSGSVTVASVSAIAIAAPFSVNVLAKSTPAALPSRSTVGGALKASKVVPTLLMLVPVLGRTETFPSPLLVTARSSPPSRLKSPAATELAPVPVAKFWAADERAIAVAEQDGDARGERIRCQDVVFAVGIHVRDAHAGGRGLDGEGRRPAETARAVAEQDRHVAGRLVGGGEIEEAVAVEVRGRDRDRVGTRADRERGGGAEGAVANADQDRDVVGTAVADDKIRNRRRG